MEGVESDQNGNSNDLSADENFAYASGDSDPKPFPHIGDEYQALVPALMSGPEYVLYKKKPIDAEKRDHVSEFVLGLPIPLVLINKASYRGSELSLVPGICSVSWTEIEKASFLLGMYTFEKNFVQVKRFVESKKMEDIQAFYYGQFYCSKEYKRWSKCHKIKKRKCAYGLDIFTESRQQELLSRLFLHVSDECRKALLEVSETFNNDKMSLEEYVSCLKNMVGMKTLVEAIGIGKGKHDMTRMAVEPVKSNQGASALPVPTGNVCSSLTPTEILKLLTGGGRLSKSRSYELFWEAVWPRLLARGWHSEEAQNEAYALRAKQSLVFLTPGVKKFDKGELEKGNHYFDSITDVLSKVSSEPELLELEAEKDEGQEKAENVMDENEIKEQADDLPAERQRHRYLQPRTTPNRITDAVKFTVLDTSMTNGKLLKFRELRTLPMEIPRLSLSEDGDQGTSNLSNNDSNSGFTMLGDQEETDCTTQTQTLSDRGMIFVRKYIDSSCPDKGVHISSPYSTREPRKKPNLGSVTNQKTILAACNIEEMSSVLSTTVPLAPKYIEEVQNCCSNSPDTDDKSLSCVGSFQDRLSSTSSSKGNPMDSIIGAPDERYHGQENPQACLGSRILIDLNVPQFPEDYETGVFMTNSTNMQDDTMIKQEDDTDSSNKQDYVMREQNNDPLAPRASTDVTSTTEQLGEMNSRRQSTRNRPPTARALEALVSGYLTTNRKRKKEGDEHESSRSRRARRARFSMGPAEMAIHNEVIASEGGIGVSNGNGTGI